MIRHFCLTSTWFTAMTQRGAAIAAVSLVSARVLAQQSTPAEAIPTPPPAQPEVGSTPGYPTAETAPAPQPPDPAPKIHLSEDPPRKMAFDAAPAPTGMNRTYHYHDGFYLRAGINYGLGWGGLSLGEDEQIPIDYSGGLLDFNLLIAGTPSPGFSVGGGVFIGTFLQPDMDNDGVEVATSNLGYVLVGPFVDGYFDANGGWHLGALAGFAGLGKTPHNDRAYGLGGSVWVGYDAWVGADWALGGNLRFTAAAASGDEPVDFSASALAVSLGFSALYH
jgi:hypothetical protein